MDMAYLGYAAGFLTTIGFVPQVVRSYRTKHVHDVSVVQPVVLLVGMILWLIYGVHLGDAAIIAANVVCITLNGILVVLKITYERSRPPDA